MRDKVLQKIFPALGTVNTITLYDSFAPEIAEQVKKRVLDLHRRFSLFEQGSDIFRINEQAGIITVHVHPDTFLFFLMHWIMGGKHREHLTLHLVRQAGYGGMRFVPPKFRQSRILPDAAV